MGVGAWIENKEDFDESPYQQWWAHPKCFLEKIHPMASDFREEFQEFLDMPD